MKQRSLQWKFTPIYLPGKGNKFADAMSRSPAMNEEDEPGIEEATAGLMVHNTEGYFEYGADSITAIGRESLLATLVVSWERIQQETLKDQEMQDLKEVVTEGFPEKCSELPVVLRKYWDSREELWVAEEVVLKLSLIHI